MTYIGLLISSSRSRESVCEKRLSVGEREKRGKRLLSWWVKSVRGKKEIE